jgi:glutamate dehydrogenase/leucine dehydrogenase
VGRYAAILAPEILGTKLIAVGDEYGAVYNAKGIDMEPFSTTSKKRERSQASRSGRDIKHPAP